MKGSTKLSENAIAAENVRAEAAKCVDCKLIKGFCGKHITKLLEYEPRADLPIPPPPPSSPPPLEMTAENLQLDAKRCTDCKLVKGLCGKHITKFLEFEKRTGQTIIPPPPSSPPPPESPPSSPHPTSESLRAAISKCIECKVVKGLCGTHITKLIDFEKKTGTPAVSIAPIFATYASSKSKASKASELVRIWEEKKKQLKLAQEKLRQKKEKDKQKRSSAQADQIWSSTIASSDQVRKEKLKKDKTEREKRDQKDREDGKAERAKKKEEKHPQSAASPAKEMSKLNFKFFQFTRKKEHEEEEKELQDEGAIDAEEARLNAELAKMSKKVKNFTQPSSSPSSPSPSPSSSSSSSSKSPVSTPSNHRTPAAPAAPQSVDDEYMLLMGVTTAHPVLSRMTSSPQFGTDTLDSLDEQEYQAEMELRMLMEQEAALEAEVMRALQTK